MHATINLMKVKGSAPRSAGTRMVVSPDEQWGTIGGGELEFSCVNLARKSISAGQTDAIEFDQALGPNLGQCCGGSVKICIEFHDEKPELQHQTNSHVSLFGAGHVGQAVVQALKPLPFTIDWIDSRSDTQANIKLAQPQSWISQAPQNSHVLIMTHSHAMDLDICFAALKRECFPYVGLIGSQTKRARFISRLAQADLTAQAIDGLICPVGVQGLNSKHPAAIAAGVAAQLMMKHEETTGLFG